MQHDPVIPRQSPAASPEVMRQFQQLMSQFLQTQTVVMTAYLQGGAASLPAVGLGPLTERPGAAPFVPVLEPAIETTGSAAVVPGPMNGHGNGHGVAVVPVMPAPQPVPAAVMTAPPPPPRVSTPAGGPEVLSRLLQIVSERTGYPEEMLDADSSIEADLGIDSIKRMEILAAFQQLHGGADRGAFQALMEKLTTLRTLRETATALADVLQSQGVA